MKLIAACLVLTGCFYVDPINRRPRVDAITCRFEGSDRTCASEGYLHRNDHVELSAALVDPDGDVAKATYAWASFACTDADAAECDALPYMTSPDAKPTLGSPPNATGVRSIRVDLDVRDDRGALVTQAARFHLNDVPILELHTAQRGHVAGVPMQLTAVYNDVDEGATNIRIAWRVASPVLDPAPVLEDDEAVANPADAGSRTVGKRLVPATIGAWDVAVTATDSLNEMSEKHLLFDVGPDLPPCLALVQPIVPLGGAVLPISARTVFQVPLVDDDLDAYPPLSRDAAYGTTTFAWSILPPGATVRQPLVGATGNNVDFDPASYPLGQIVELRVEVSDRNHVAIACADSAPTCASAARPMCTQRQTWRVEVQQ